MPTYEYFCDNCENKLEEFQSFKDDPLVKCPQCKQDKLRRLISGGVGFIIRNGGIGRMGDKESTASKMGGRYIPMDSAEQKFEERMSELNN